MHFFVFFDIIPYICIMENIICIDLTKFNNEQLRKIAEQYIIDYDSLLLNKKNGFAKLWLVKDTNIIIAYTSKGDDSLRYMSTFTELLKLTENVSLKKSEKKKEPEIILNVDIILEKISKYGIESISDIEKNFLDNLGEK